MNRLAPPTIAILLLASVTIASAQTQCAALVQEAINLVANTCVGMGRNEVCHGYFRVEAQPRDQSPAFSFALGDIVDVTDVASLRTYPFNAETHEWGIALMNLQANLPDELPGANVSFLLLGDTNVSNMSAEGERPMQTLRLETGITGTACGDAPSNGLLIQTPHGVGRVMLNINEVDISLGSTVFVEAPAGGIMTISTLEGSAYVSVNGMNQTALPGYKVQIALDDDLHPLGFVGTATTYQQQTIAALPISLLERSFDLVTPLTEPLDAVAGVTDTVTTAAGDVVGTVTNTLDALNPVETVNQTLNTVQGAVDETVNTVTGTVNETVSTVTDTINETVNTVENVVDETVDNLNPTDTVEDILGGVKGLLSRKPWP